jgi:integrase
MVHALPRTGKRRVLSDPELRSHYLRVPAGPGPIAYTVILKRNGRQEWASVGDTDEMDIETARAAARVAIARLKAGKPAKEPPAKPPQSVTAVAKSWLTRHVDKNQLRTADQYRYFVDRHIVPGLGARDFVSLRRSDIVNFLDSVEDKHGPHVADAVLGTLKSISSWQQGRADDYIPPFARGMKRVSKQQHQRTRVLSDTELATVWRAAEKARTLGAIIRLLLLTCQRREKVYRMRWADISPDGIWSIPTEQREKGNGGRLRLPAAALAIIKAQPHFESSPYVFTQRPSPRTVTGFQTRCGVKFRLHDLRRTSRTILSRIGIAHEIAESLLGHTLPGVSGVYNRDSFEPQKAVALAKLAATIKQIVYPADNVVPLREVAS